MKKVMLAGLAGVFTLGMMSCGGGHGACDAYRKSDYAKYKEQKTQQIKFVEFKTKEKK
jgi:hypothetical protein